MKSNLHQELKARRIDRRMRKIAIVCAVLFILGIAAALWYGIPLPDYN